MIFLPLRTVPVHKVVIVDLHNSSQNLDIMNFLYRKEHSEKLNLQGKQYYQEHKEEVLQFQENIEINNAKRWKIEIMKNMFVDAERQTHIDTNHDMKNQRNIKHG